MRRWNRPLQGSAAVDVLALAAVRYRHADQLLGEAVRAAAARSGWQEVADFLGMPKTSLYRLYGNPGYGSVPFRQRIEMPAPAEELSSPDGTAPRARGSVDGIAIAIPPVEPVDDSDVGTALQ